MELGANILGGFMKHQSRSGFSLVELMVVVAIIGILATIAVPNFQRFTARAKQANAKTELTGIFTAQKAFFTEYSQYHGHLPAIGYVPEGVDGTVANYPVLAGTIRIYGTSSGAANEPAALDAPLPSAPGGLAYAGAFTASAACGAMSTAAAVLGAFGVQPEATLPASPAIPTFRAVAKGCPRSSSQAAAAGQNAVDVWSMDQNRVMRNDVSGI